MVRGVYLEYFGLSTSWFDILIIVSIFAKINVMAVNNDSKIDGDSNDEIITQFFTWII